MPLTKTRALKCRRARAVSKMRLFIIVFITFTIPAAVTAKLAPTTLTELLEDSDLVMVASVVDIRAGYSTDGSAVLDVQEIMKGIFPEKQIEITWTNEVHDQRIRERGLRLLFLRKTNDGNYTVTHYGRSYWPLYHSLERDNEDCRYYTPYIYPSMMIRLEDKLVLHSLRLEMRHHSDKSYDSICFEDIRRLIESSADK